MGDSDIQNLRDAIAALQAQRRTLGDAVVDLATAPLRERLAALLRPIGLQHRQVTVLFADVVGSTALSQSLDAEDTLDLLSGALRRMAAVVDAHQGRVLRFTGDGVKAAFGMDEAREDDAERAVRAGLAILAAGREQAAAALRQHGLADFGVRVGVHTGDVALGAGVEADNTAMGAAVNIAARMEQSAPPGGLRISHDTWSQVRGLFDLQAQPPLQVKGVDAPLQTYLVLGALDRSTVAVERGLQGLRTPLVGRQTELQRLLHTVARTRQTGQMQALTLLGEAGLGKSRLLRELRAALQDPQTGGQVLALRSQPDGMLHPWGLLRSLLAVHCGVADTDSADLARRKVVDGLAPCFQERGERQAQLIGQLSGLDYGSSPHVRGLDPRALREQAWAALRACLQALAAPLGTLQVLLVEDLHWADDSSLDLLQHLLDHAAELPLALVMTARPTLLARRPDWGPPDTRLLLAPLAAAQSDELALALLQRLDPVPPALLALIVSRAEGNPYYMEELVRRLIDDGVIVVGPARWTAVADRLDTLRLPGTLVGLLQARLDALPAGDRHAARQASVIGHVFWDDALQALDAKAPQALPALQRAAFVKDHDTSDFAGTPERQFDHHLLHQVTYDTLLKAERRLGHAAAARWLSERTQGRGAEFLAMTGEHAERAGDTDLAITCFEQAGQQAEQRFANAAAAAWLRRALALLGESAPARRLDLLARLEVLADTLGDRPAQEAVHQAMAALLQQHPSDAGQALLCWCQALLADRRSDTATAQGHCRQASAWAESCGAAHTAARARGLMGWLTLSQGDCEGARGHIEIGLTWAARIDAPELRAVAEAQLLTISAMVSNELCHFGQARQALLAVLARGEAIPSLRLQSAAMDNLAEAAVRQGQWDELRAWAQRLLALAEAYGSQRDLARAQTRMSLALWSRGDAAAALPWCEQSLVSHRRVGDRYMEAVALRSLGWLHFERGDVQTALDFCQQAQALYATPTETLQACEATVLAALCQVRLGQEQAAQTAREAVDAVLGQLQGPLAALPAHDTLGARWGCCQVLLALHDPRAPALLAPLHADVLARADQLTDASDRQRLIQAVPSFRDIVAAVAQRGQPGQTEAAR